MLYKLNIVCFIVLISLSKLVFSQINYDSVLLQEQNPNYLKSKTKYLKTMVSTNTNALTSTQLEPVLGITRDTLKLSSLELTSQNTKLNVQQRLIALKKILAAAQQKKDVNEITNALKNIAFFYDKEHNLPMALEYYSLTLQQYYATKNNKEATEILSHIAIVYEQQLNYKKAQEYYETALELAKKNHNSEYIKLTSNALSKLFEKQGNYKNAYQMHLLFQQMSDSLYKTEQEKMLQLQNFNKLRLVDSLEKVSQQQTYLHEIELKNSEVHRSKKGILLISLGLAIVSALSFFLYRNYQKAKHSNNIISAQKKDTEAQKQIIEEALIEKELLLKEVHHRVKNNLQIISSLLNLQSNKTDNQDVKKIMSEATNRINSMALIHQKMYQSGNLSSIDFQGYIEHMIETMEVMFNNQKTAISYRINTNHISLNMDVAIPLGLIVNELLTNCYKYAFPNKQEGVIEIILQKKNDNELQLQVSDNGIGLPKNFDANTSKSLGLKLVKGLSQQLKGMFTYDTHNGSHFYVDFKKV